MHSGLDYGEIGTGPSQPQTRITRIFGAESEGDIQQPWPIHEKPDDLHENKHDACNYETETGSSDNLALLSYKTKAGPVDGLYSHASPVNDGIPSREYVVGSREKRLAIVQLIVAANDFVLQLFLVFLSLWLLLNGQEHSALGVDPRYVQHAFNLFVASLRDGDDAVCMKRTLRYDAVADRPYAASEPKESPNPGVGTAWPTGGHRGSSADYPTEHRSVRGTRGPDRPRGSRGSTRGRGGNGRGGGRGNGRGGGRGGSGGGSPSNRPEVAPDDPRLFACHFSLLPDGRYNCPGFKRLSDVPIHLFRKHMQPKHCPQCKLTLKNDADEQRHIIAGMARPCLYNDYVHPGITPDQRVDITTRSHRLGTPEQRWNDIWRILFPALQPPSSPYIVSSFTCRLRREISKFQHDGHLQNAVDRIAPIGSWYGDQSPSAWVLQCLLSFVEHVEREDGAAPVRASQMDRNADMTESPSLPNAPGPRPPPPSSPFHPLFTSVPVLFSPPAAIQSGEFIQPYFPDSRGFVDTGAAFIIDELLPLGFNDPGEYLPQEIQYDIANLIHLDPVPEEEDVGQGAPDTQWS